MRIESIKLKNFRQLQNLELYFDKKDGKKDLHIIHANNGVGKTNILNAITWCLYDKENHLQNRNTAQEMLNSSVTAELRLIGGGVADVCVEIGLSADDESQRIIFKRVANFNVTTSSTPVRIDDTFTSKKLENNEWNIVGEEAQQEILNKYIPETINNYILFDGEQLEKFFNIHSMENVKNGINELTQASYLEKSSKALADYIKFQLNPQLVNGSDSEISNKQKKIDNIQTLIEECKSRIEVSQEQIKICEEQIESANNIIRGCESVKDKMDDMQRLEGEREEVNNLIDGAKKELWCFSHKFFQNVALAGCVRTYYDFIKKQESYGKLPPRVDRGILEKILSSHKCPICNSDVPDIEFVRQLEKTLDIATGTASVLNKSIGALSHYDVQVKEYASKKSDLSAELNRLEQKSKHLDESISTIDQYLRTFTDKEAISNAIDTRNQFKKERDKHLGLIGREEQKIAELKKQFVEVNEELQKLLKKNSELEFVQKKIDFCKCCRKIIDETRDEILTECRKAMQTETFRIFERLVWKEDTFAKVEIGEDYTLRLYDTFGNQTLGSCSAAETALLALSFTLALQEISKHDSLLFIDTPIGRVDPQNRENFIRTLLDVSVNKQVILTFTPSEYDSSVKSIINNAYSTLSSLSQTNGITTLFLN